MAASVAASEAASVGRICRRASKHWRIEHAFDTLPVMMATQGSLLDVADEPSVDTAFARATRADLGRGAWLDMVPGWIDGADILLDRVVAAAPWASHDRWMYDRMLTEPRLSTRGWAAPPEPVLGMVDALSGRYGLALDAVSANLYRDGRDSVAWHGDTAGRRVATTVVAIAVLGAPRRFLLRPRGGGTALRLTPGHGDLLVMGGSCQRTWEHAVPKCAVAGVRVALMFREPGVF